MYIKIKKTLSNKKKVINGCGIIGLIIISILFLQITPIITYDSVGYFKYIDFLKGIIPLSQWNPVRGFSFPLLLWMSQMISPSGVGLAVTFLIIYLIFVIYIYKILSLIKYGNFLSNKIIIYIICLTIALNPIIWGYFHFVLTECVGMTLLVLFIYYSIDFFIYRIKKDEANEKINIYRLIFYIILSSVMTIILYFLKQNFIANTIFILLSLELLLTIKIKKIKTIMCSFLILFLTVMSLFLSIKVWNNMIEVVQNEGNLMLTNMLGNFRYLEPDPPIFWGEARISVKNDDYTERDSFVYNFEMGLSNKIKYWSKCITKYPERVLAGYFDNYMLLCDIYQNPWNKEGINYVWGSVIKNDIIGTISNRSEYQNLAGEHRNLVIHNIKQGFDSQEFINGTKQLFIDNNIMSDYVKNYTYINGTEKSIVKVMTNDVLLNIVFLIYSIIMFFSPIICIYYVIRCCKKSKQCEDFYYYSLNFSLSFYSFCFIFMHAVMGQPIDRYVVPAYLLLFIVFIQVVFNLVFNINKWVKLILYKSERDL